MQAAIDVVLGGVSAAFDTLAEIATALGTKVIAPGTNAANRVPRWNGANTKTLSDGLDVGTAANNLVQLDGFAKLPAVDGSQLTNMPSAFTTGDAKLTYKMVADPGWVLLNDGLDRQRWLWGYDARECRYAGFVHLVIPASAANV